MCVVFHECTLCVSVHVVGRGRGWGLHPYKRVRQTRQRGNDRWEETASDKGRTGWEDFYWQAAQSKVMRAFGHKPSTTSLETSSGQISTFPFAVQSYFKPLPASKWQLSFTEVSRQHGYNPRICQMSQRRWANTLLQLPVWAQVQVCLGMLSTVAMSLSEWRHSSRR